MFDKITEFMDTKLSTPMAKLAEQRHLRAVRDGIIATLPIIIVYQILYQKIGELHNLFKLIKQKFYYHIVFQCIL